MNTKTVKTTVSASAHTWAANRPWMLRTDVNGKTVARVREVTPGGPWRASLDDSGAGTTFPTQIAAMAYIEGLYP